MTCVFLSVYFLGLFWLFWGGSLHVFILFWSFFPDIFFNFGALENSLIPVWSSSGLSHSFAFWVESVFVVFWIFHVFLIPCSEWDYALTLHVVVLVVAQNGPPSRFPQNEMKVPHDPAKQESSMPNLANLRFDNLNAAMILHPVSKWNDKVFKKKHFSFIYACLPRFGSMVCIESLNLVESFSKDFRNKSFRRQRRP